MMKYISIAMAMTLVLGAVLFLKAKPEAMSYQKGDKIKNYRLLKDDGTAIETMSMKGKWLVMYFYPKDDTPGCTKEAQTFTSLLGDFHAANAEVFGVNTDSPESHRKFKEKYGLKVTLLTDEKRSTMTDFAVKIIAGFCSRDTVLINPEGKLEETFRGVSPEGHPGEILKYIQDHSGIPGAR